MLKKWFKVHWRETLGAVLLLSAFFFTHRFFFLPGDFRTHDNVHFIRLYDLDKVLREGQFPPRWLPDLGKGFGYPFFNFYPLFAYFVGEVFHILGFSITMSDKLSFATAGLIGVVGMLFLVKHFFNYKVAVFANFLWLLLPYRAVDLYVRGSLAEYWGMNLLPILFYFLFVFLKKRTWRHFFFLIFGWFLLLITHNVVALLTTILIGLCFLFYFCLEKNKRLTPYLWQILAIGMMAFSLAAFFIVPALLEQKYVKIGGMRSNYFFFQNHFPSIYQLLFSSFWGYGGSNFFTVDGMAFQVGYLQWIIPLLAIGWLGYRFFKRRKLQPVEKWVFFFFLLFLGFLFLDHQRSTFIWKMIPFLPLIQFPWRLLIFIGFFSSLVGSYFYYRLTVKWPRMKEVFLILGLTLLVLFNYRYFKPRQIETVGDEEYLQGELWDYLRREFMDDYLPKTVLGKPSDYYSPPLIENVTEGEARMLVNQADYLSLAIDTEKKQEIVVKRFFFPGWQANWDSQEIPIQTDKNGFMVLEIPGGRYSLVIEFKNTLVRRLANGLSLLSGFIMVVLVFSRKARAKLAFLNFEEK